MKFLPYLLYLSAAGPAVLCQELDEKRSIYLRDEGVKGQMSSLNRLLRRRPQNLKRGSSTSGRQLRERQSQTISQQLRTTAQSVIAIRRRNLDFSAAGEQVESTQHFSKLPRHRTRHREPVTSNAKELNPVVDSPRSSLRRRGNCIGAFCGARSKDISKLDEPYDASAGTSHSFIAPSPFAMIPENLPKAGKARAKASSSRRMSDSVQSVDKGSPTSPLLGDGSKRKDSATGSSQPSGSAKTSSAFSLTRSHGDAQISEELNKAYSVLEKTSSGQLKPGLQGKASDSPPMRRKHSKETELSERKSDKTASSASQLSAASSKGAGRTESRRPSSQRSHPHDEGSSKPTSGESSDSAKHKVHQFKDPSERQAALSEALSNAKLSKSRRRRTKMGGASASQRRSRDKTDPNQPTTSGGSSITTSRRQKKTDKDSDKQQAETPAEFSKSGGRRSEKSRSKRKDLEATDGSSRRTKSPPRAVPPVEKSKST